VKKRYRSVGELENEKEERNLETKEEENRKKCAGEKDKKV